MTFKQIQHPVSSYSIYGIVRFIIAILLGMTVILGGFFYLITENYFPVYPHIDTYFAEGYTDEAFAQVEIGMTKAEVEALLGAPLHMYSYDYGSEYDIDTTWEYTQDGAALIGDFAWDYRVIFFNNDLVVQKEQTWVYD